MALLSYALTTLSRAKQFMEISGNDDNDLITNIINNATAYIEKYCDRRFKQTSYTNQYYDGTGTQLLLLKQYPVNTDETFTLEERTGMESDASFDAIDSSFYHIKDGNGIVQLVGTRKFREYPKHYRVTYTAGYDYNNTDTYLSDTAASDVELACWKLVTSIYKERRQSQNVASESIGDYNITFARETSEDAFLRSVLENYKRRVRM